mmetsp:Transcript_53732/g.151354  ORF Transcript_53732/g.151354 Transcript_53732/m.151354 type:complete len:257 (+) Transcript_53732:1341-2111(+)
MGKKVSCQASPFPAVPLNFQSGHLKASASSPSWSRGVPSLEIFMWSRWYVHRMEPLGRVIWLGMGCFWGSWGIGSPMSMSRTFTAACGTVYRRFARWSTCTGCWASLQKPSLYASSSHRWLRICLVSSSVTFMFRVDKSRRSSKIRLAIPSMLAEGASKWSSFFGYCVSAATSRGIFSRRVSGAGCGSTLLCVFASRLAFLSSRLLTTSSTSPFWSSGGWPPTRARKCRAVLPSLFAIVASTFIWSSHSTISFCPW